MDGAQCPPPQGRGGHVGGQGFGGGGRQDRGYIKAVTLDVVEQMRELSPVGIVRQAGIKVAYRLGPAALVGVETGQSCCGGLHQHCLVVTQGDCVLVGTGEALIGVVDAARGTKDGDTGGERGVDGMQCLRPAGCGVRGPGERRGVHRVGQVPDP
ncbi:Uncharacterised protein [Mycobacteroides abscessus subsp. abscessus]|nr:Uncharacterised protein [Mycobacteroides abscessus subsp. abscessus]